jgi:hypothetical protein
MHHDAQEELLRQLTEKAEFGVVGGIRDEGIGVSTEIFLRHAACPCHVWFGTEGWFDTVASMVTGGCWLHPKDSGFDDTVSECRKDVGEINLGNGYNKVRGPLRLTKFKRGTYLGC